MATIEIYWDDLTREKQAEILEVLGENGNFDIIPIALIEFDEDESQDMTQGMQV